MGETVAESGKTPTQKKMAAVRIMLWAIDKIGDVELAETAWRSAIQSVRGSDGSE